MSVIEEVNQLLREYRRPWKLFTLAIGIGLLVAGSFYYKAPDWDISISFIMAILAYLAAPWSMRVLLERQWRRLPLMLFLTSSITMLFLTWFTVDGCYWIYWSQIDPVALELMRDVNFPASLSLYSMCRLGWYFNGSLREFYLEARSFLSRG